MADEQNNRILSVNQARVILGEGRFEDFKGVVESTHLDFKREPYPLSGATPPIHERAKRDLVEDVVRFANVEGGIIILGIEAEQLEGQRTEIGKVVHTFPEWRIDAGQYRDVILERVKPQPEEVVIQWFPACAGEGGIGAVIVPPQSPHLRKTFFATRTLVDETTGKTLGAYVGYVERRGAEGITMSAEELYQTFQAGRRFSDLKERLDSLTEMVKLLVEQRVVSGLPSVFGAVRMRLPGPEISDVRTRRDDSVRQANLHERPTFSLVAVPGEEVDVPELFAGSRSELVRLLESPPELRESGFNLAVGERPVIVPPATRRAVSVGGKVLQLSRDGVLIFAADAQDLLCWGTRNEDQPLRLNVLAIAEVTYLFSELVCRLNRYLVPAADTWRYVIGFDRMEVNGKPAVLGPGPRRSAHQSFPWNQRALQSTQFEFASTPIPVTTDVRVVALRLRRELYVAFGFDEDAIPYVTNVNGERGTDPEKIKEDGKVP
jgi:hypothetical protein